MSEERSWLDKGKRVVRRTGKAYTGVTGTLSGKNVEQQITEYSELYTQVLLGLHQDLEAQKRKLDDYGSEIKALAHQVATMQGVQEIEAQGRRLQDHDSEIEGLKRQVAALRTVRIIAIAALVIAVVSAGGALWAAL